MQNDIQQHWEKVYATKLPHERSWTQTIPQISLDLINSFHLAKDAAIIDVGGGDSLLADNLLNMGFTDITVLDISSAAIEAAKKRLAEKSAQVHWVAGDILEFSTERNYTLWHDRAAFHFLTSPQQISAYVNAVSKYVTDCLVIGTFSDKGPQKCSGLTITQYNREKLSLLFAQNFELINCMYEDHQTPFGTSQNFIFCAFKRRTGK